MSSTVRRFINSIPSNRTARALQNALDHMIPTNKDIAITAHAGGGQASAKALNSDASFHDVTTVATAADSVVLPYPKSGDYHFVKNSAAANAMQVYAVTPGTIDSVATGTGVSQLAGDAVLYYCMSDGNYLRLGGVQATEVFGAITVDSIAAGDASLGVTGLAAAQGGEIALTGGTSSTAGNAGGAVTLTGGTPGSTGIGGAVTLTAGAGGSASNNGGVASLVGGAGTAGNGVGGVSKSVGGAGQGSGAGGAVQATGGQGGATGTGGAATITSGAGGATSGASGNVTLASGTATAGSGSASGTVTVQSGAGAASAAAVAGGASGAVTLKSQDGGANTGGATGQVGGDAGAVTVQGGAGGATNSAGAHAGGAGSDVSITAGAGGNASAGTGNGGAGGTIALTPGAGGTSAGGTAGVAGTLRLAGQITSKVTVTAMTTTAAITVAALRGGMITANQGAAGAATYTTPTGAEIAAAMPADFTTGDSFFFSITNLSTNAAEDITVAAGASGITLKGNMTVASNDAVGSIAAATFRVVCSGAATYDIYRVS